MRTLQQIPFKVWYLARGRRFPRQIELVMLDEVTRVKCLARGPAHLTAQQMLVSITSGVHPTIPKPNLMTGMGLTGSPLTKLTKFLGLYLQTSPGLLPLSAMIHCIFSSFTLTTFVFVDSSQISPYSAFPRLAHWGFPPWPAPTFWTDLDRTPTSWGSQRS